MTNNFLRLCCLGLFLCGSLGGAHAVPIVTTNESPGEVSNLLTTTTLKVANYVSQATNSFLGKHAQTGQATTRVAVNADETGAAASASDIDHWHVWGGYGRSAVAYEFQPLASEGDVDVAMLGMDYSVSRSLLVGAVLSGERTRVDNTYSGGQLSGDGVTFSPYLAWQIDPSWSLDAAAGVGYTRLDQTVPGVTGENHDNRYFASVGLRWDRALGRWLVSGRGNVMTASDRLSAYTLSDTTPVAESKTRVTQGRLGLQFAYDGGGWMPFVGVAYIHDISSPDQAPEAGQTAANDKSGIQYSLGAQFFSKGMLYGGASYVTEQSRQEIKNDQFLLNMGLRF